MTADSGEGRTEEVVRLRFWDCGEVQRPGALVGGLTTRSMDHDCDGRDTCGFEVREYVPATLLAQERFMARQNADHAAEERARAESAEKQRDEAETEAAQWEGSFNGMVEVEKRLKAERDEALARVERLEAELRGTVQAAEEFKRVAETAVSAERRATQAEAALEERTRALRAIVTSLEVNQPVPTAVYNAARAALQSEKE